MVKAAKLAGIVLTLSGCTRGCREHPYVPYRIGDESPAPRDSTATRAEGAGDAAKFEVQEATAAPANVTEWTLGGVKLAAPAGMTFALGVTGDFDGDGETGAVALVSSADSDASAPTMQIVHYLGAQAESTLALPAVEAGEGCAPVRRMVRVGRHSVFVEVGADCEATESAGHRWIGIVNVQKSARVTFGAKVIDLLERRASPSTRTAWTTTAMASMMSL